MEGYFYLKNAHLKGPCSLEELKEKKLSIDTLIWTDQADCWKRLWELPELDAVISEFEIQDEESAFKEEIKFDALYFRLLNVMVK